MSTKKARMSVAVKGTIDTDSAAMQCLLCGAYTPSQKNSFCISCEAQSNLDDADDYAVFSKDMGQLYMDSVVGKTEKLDAFARAKRQQALPAGILYGIGVLYSNASSYMYYDRDYTRKGFMEENSSNIYSALSLTSRFKEFMYKALDSLSSDSRHLESNEYLKFMVNIRLGRMTYARRSLALIPAADSNAHDYAQMVYHITIRSKDSMAYINKMLDKGVVNASYYLARHLAQTKRFDEAATVLQEFTLKWKSPMASHMLNNLLYFTEKKNG